MTPEQAVAEHSRLVHALVRKFYKFGNVSGAFDFEDLLQIGFIGLIRGAERFDPSKGFKPSSYLAFYIKGEVFRFLRDNVVAMRMPRHMSYKDKIANGRSISLEHVVAEDDGPLTLMDLIGNEDDLSEIEMQDIIDRTLDEKQRKIVYMRSNGLLQREIGEHFGVTQKSAWLYLEEIKATLQEAIS